MRHYSLSAKNDDVYNLFQGVDSVVNRSEFNRELYFRCKCLKSQKDEINSCIDHDLIYNNRKSHQHQKEGVYLLQIYFITGYIKLHNYSTSCRTTSALNKVRADLKEKKHWE